MKAITLHAPWGTLLHTVDRRDGREWEAFDQHDQHPPVPCIDQASARATASRIASQVSPWSARRRPMVKRFETRSWACPPSIIGQRIAIHQAVKRPPANWTAGDYRIRGYGRTGYALEGPGLTPFRSTPRLEGCFPPFGCIVASGVITRSLPIVGPADNVGHALHADLMPCIEFRGDRPRPGSPVRLLLWDTRGGVDYIDDQLPYGDFTPGRFAWELSDVAATTECCPLCRNQFDGKMPGGYYGSNWDWVPCQTCMGEGKCEPIPAKGAQRFWEWRP